MTWQPIETAPLGEPILAYNPVVGVYYTVPMADAKGSLTHPCFHWGYRPGNWYPVPSHWQPLPEPPEDAGS